LEEVKDKQARISVKGSATGIELGAFVKLAVQASCQFDFGAQRIVAMHWEQKDERGQGPASPATTVETKTTLKRASISQPETLSDSALVAVPEGLEPPPFLTQLCYRHEGKPRFTLNHAREWTQVGQTREHVIFRLMDRGDLVAQATLTPWDAARPGQHLEPVAFRDAVSKNPGWQQGEIVQEGEIPAEKGYWIYRITASGEMDEMRVLQSFFLVAGPSGDQVVVVFTMTPSQADKIGMRDLDFVRGIEMNPAAGN
jgi:hypothetical protein